MSLTQQRVESYLAEMCKIAEAYLECASSCSLFHHVFVQQQTAVTQKAATMVKLPNACVPTANHCNRFNELCVAAVDWHSASSPVYHHQHDRAGTGDQQGGKMVTYSVMAMFDISSCCVYTG